jgi:nitrogen-specific signal transduction histidine kinase
MTETPVSRAEPERMSPAAGVAASSARRRIQSTIQDIQRQVVTNEFWGLPLFLALFAVTFTLFVFLVTIFGTLGQDILPFAGVFIFLSAIFWLIDPLLKERLPVAVSNIILISLYLIAAQLLLLFSGGLHSRLFVVYYFVVFTGAMSYGLSGSMAVTALVAMAYATFIETSAELPLYFINIIVLWIISLMVGFLAETKRRVERRETLQNMRLSALGEIARFMRELESPKDVVEAGLDALLRLLGAESVALVRGEEILHHCGAVADVEGIRRGIRFRLDLVNAPAPKRLSPSATGGLVSSAAGPDADAAGLSLVILRPRSPLSGSEERIVRLLSEKMQLIMMHLEDRTRIEASRAEKERVLESIGTAVMTVSPEGFVLTANRRASEILGMPSDKLVGRSVLESPFLFPSAFEFGNESREVELHSAIGEPVPVEMRIVEEIDELGKRTGWILVFDDLKELRRLKAIIRRSEALAAVGEMSARVAHEIRNPLGGILGFLGLAEKKAQPEIRGYISESKAAVRRLERIVQDLLTFARPIQKVPGAFALVDAWTTLERSEFAQESESISPPRAHVRPLAPKLLDARLRGDFALFDQMLRNIIRNAKEAAGPNGYVCVRARWGDPQIWIEIDDDGSGLPEEIGDKIFEPFVSTKENGSGLGLAIARRIIEELGGGIRYSRVLDEDGRQVTRFRIAWPRAQE